MIVDGSIDSTPVNCTVEPSVSVTADPAQAFYTNNNMSQTVFYAALAALNADATPDLLAIELYAGAGAFMSGFPATGATIQLTGAEAQYATCAGCVLIYADSTQQALGEPYLATSGTLTLTSISTTSLAGSVSNVGFRHVTIDDMSFMSADHPDGCQSTLSSASFTAVPTMQTARTLPDGTVEQGMRYKLTFDKRAN